VLAQTYTEISRIDRRLALVLFDEHFLQNRAAPVLARAILPGPPPTARELLEAWRAQLALPEHRSYDDVAQLCDDFLTRFMLNLRSRDEFRAFFDSAALDAVRDELRHVRRHLETPPNPAGGAEVRRPEEFSPPIRRRFDELDRAITALTEDQYRIITQLHAHRRALISGCAGSGKTLVAAEKALRLARAGISTLFLCHSPLLAEWVGSLIAGANVRALTVEKLVDELLALAPEPATGPWSHYSEPTPAQLNAAFDVAVESGPHYEALLSIWG
jgi:hypothetical protein